MSRESDAGHEPCQRPTNRSGRQALPPYVQVKRYVLKCIRDGVWGSGARIPVEVELAMELNLARMTVSRALRELADEGVLARVPGSGTYVTPGYTDKVEIRPIAVDIRESGRTHRALVMALERGVDDRMQRIFEVRPGDPARELLRSKTVHFDDGVPVQLEDLYVDSARVPHYDEQDFTRRTPGEYLRDTLSLRVTALRVFAQRPPPAIRDELKMQLGEPCLVVYHESRTGDDLVCVSTLWHPSSRFHLGGTRQL